MNIDVNQTKIDEILTRGVEQIIEKDSLIRKLQSGKRLRIKHGIDPTGPKIHLGRASQLLRLRKFQEMGHQVVLIIGDFTAQIGDASDKQAKRRILTEQEIKENMKDYLPQIGRILDINKVELHYNSEWLDNLSSKELIRLSMSFTAQQLIQRRNFKERWQQNKPIGLHELDYPLLQGYDSVAVRADIEVGGFDQLFNLKVGRIIQRLFNQKMQDVIAFKMLPGLDGRKMSTSWGNVINITETAQDMYGKIMSMKDDLIRDYFELCTNIPLKELQKMQQKLVNKEISLRDMKARLAKEIVTFYYDKDIAIKTEKEFNRIFKEKKLPTDIPKIKIKEKSLNILDLLIKTQLVSSKLEARRLVSQKAVKINNNIKNNWKENIDIKNRMIIKIGKRRFVRIN